MENFLIVAVIVGFVALAARAVYRSKKQGNPCIGCSACQGGCCGNGCAVDKSSSKCYNGSNGRNEQ